MKMAEKYKEKPEICNAIGSHHNDVEPNCPESILVQIADAISAARPGARRETLDNYIKRLENLETIAESFSGVDKAFAIQAGRELRILVNYENVSDEQAKEMCKSIAKKIETDLRYPGRIKVTIIRETRIVEFADTADLFARPQHPYTEALLSAIPVPDPALKRPRTIMQGDVPSPIRPPPGCHFHPRCPIATDRCKVETPMLKEGAPRHEVACHLR